MRRMEHRRAAMLALAALVLATAACSSPTPKAISKPAPTNAGSTAPPVAGQEFVSKRYGFGLTLAKGWSDSDAQIAWNGKELEGLESPAFADFAELRTGREFTVGAAPVAKGMRLAAWRAAMVYAAPSECVDSRTAKRTTLGGEPALIWTATCGSVHNTKIAAVHGRRGYMAIFELSDATETAADRRLLESIRGSFRFTG